MREKSFAHTAHYHLVVCSHIYRKLELSTIQLLSRRVDRRLLADHLLTVMTVKRKYLLLSCFTLSSLVQLAGKAYRA